MNLKGFVLGIDGGGTKTLGMLADLEGKILAKVFRQTSNPQIVGFDSAARVVLEVLKECCTKAGCSPRQLRAVVVGLAGAGRDSDRRRVFREIRRLARRKRIHLGNIRVESDARIAVEGALAGKSGIVLISGTGSIGMARDAHGNIFRVGGWGREIGDEGSGYAIGRQALGAVAKHLDGRGERTLLTRLVAKRFGLRDAEAIIRKVYQNNFDLAHVAPLVLHAAARGDQASRRILEDSSRELAEHLKSLMKKLSDTGPTSRRKRFGLVLTGGLLGRRNYLTMALKKRARRLFPNLQIQRPRFLPAYGAVIVGLRQVRYGG